MSDNISRRTFFKRVTAASLLSTLAATGLDKPVQATETRSGKLGTLFVLR